MLFEQDLLPGYAWVFPLPGGRANVGFGVLRGPGVDGKWIKATWRDLLTRHSMRAVLGPDAEPEAPHRAWPIPTAYDPDRLVDGRVLFTGDAASVVDPMTGEGIAQAIETGVLAADAVIRWRRRRARATDPWSSVTSAATCGSRVACNACSATRSGPGPRSALRTCLRGPRRNFARWMFEDYPRALLFTPDRWHRGMFTAPGAYRASTLTPQRAVRVAGAPGSTRIFTCSSGWARVSNAAGTPSTPTLAVIRGVTSREPSAIAWSVAANSIGS